MNWRKCQWWWPFRWSNSNVPTGARRDRVPVRVVEVLVGVHRLGRARAEALDDHRRRARVPGGRREREVVVAPLLPGRDRPGGQRLEVGQQARVGVRVDRDLGGRPGGPSRCAQRLDAALDRPVRSARAQPAHGEVDGCLGVRVGDGEERAEERHELDLHAVLAGRQADAPEMKVRVVGVLRERRRRPALFDPPDHPARERGERPAGVRVLDGGRPVARDARPVTRVGAERPVALGHQLPRAGRDRVLEEAAHALPALQPPGRERLERARGLRIDLPGLERTLVVRRA